MIHLINPEPVAKHRPPRKKRDYANPWRLTPAETKVIEAWIENGEAKQAAVAIGVSYKTIEGHSLSIRKKMAVPTTLLAVLAYDRWNRE